MFGLILLTLWMQGPRDLQLPENAPAAKQMVVPQGTVIPVELINRISTKNIKEGDNVYARTTFPITANNQIVIPVGTNVRGKVKQAQRPGRIKGKPSLTLSFQVMILPDGVTLPIYGSLGGSDEGNREGESTIVGESTKGKDAGTVAKAGATGAVIGGLVKGKKGAVLGGGIPAGVALAGVLLSRGEDLDLPRGTMIEIVLDEQLEF